jgi:hypothetical protein
MGARGCLGGGVLLGSVLRIMGVPGDPHVQGSQRTRLISRGVLALLNRSPGHKREFSLTDISIQHSYAEHERVPP